MMRADEGFISDVCPMQPAGTRDARRPAGASRAAMGRVDVLDFALGCPGVRRLRELVKKHEKHRLASTSVR